MNTIQDNATYKLFLFLSISCIALLLPNKAEAQEDEQEPIVWDVSFEGNENYRDMVLNEIIATSSPGFFQKIFGRTGDFALNEMEVRRDRIRIMRYYERRGYPNVDVSYEIKDRKKAWKKDVVFLISEGNPLQIRSTEIEIDATSEIADEIRSSREYKRAEEQHAFQVGNRYQTLRRVDVEGRFLNLLEELGFAWPEVEIEAEVDSVASRADITIKANPNAKTYFSDIEIEGEISVPERILIRETDIKEGELYRQSKLQDAQRQVFNHHLFRFATITIPDQPQDSTLNVILRVREHPKRSVQATIGFGREELLRTQVSWQNRNITGTGHRFGVSGRASFIEQRLSTDFLVPYVFNTRSSNVSSIFGQHKLEPSFELLRAGFNNSLIYQFDRTKTATASYEFSINEELSRNSDSALPDSVLNYNVSSLSFSGYYSEGLSREPRGWVIQPFIEISGTFSESTFTFQKALLDVRRYTHLTNHLVFATRINTGVIFYGGEQRLPANIRFFTGGTNSVRGWNRQELGPSRVRFDDSGDFETYIPVGGRSMFTFNLELRQDLNELIPKVGLAAFLDGGQIWSDLNNMDERPIQYGAGGGIRYQSPIGPVRVDIGYKLNPTDEDLNIYEGEDFGSAWSRIGIHFSIGQAF
ncbi:autotransporter assembly complex protein TamA [Rhodohalobacter sp.]|uniref:autotransporter assembly complex protein TamA n=1 Tax=Rhodohalobacter sp. TaxID=1974210 RepID=UPI002ACD2E8B|nr:BamA/TamA family outer membrane protein [Rhodohalobacter sp.]MDZ7755012.1 BamA/TamA family outer membrane protein [Rhodohalobacter sp.]